ncbi:MAG: ATP-binding protein [Verrucomicrobia bacterium]|nr:ATP-binding protein [Verrucomicrobiota bacterium]
MSMTAATRIPITFFAPAERVPIEIVQRQASSFGAIPMASTLLNSGLNLTLVLNQQRQIVFASENVLALTPGKKMEDLLGKRPGEALGCIHASTCESGCGTSEFCSQCGAVRAILNGLEGRRDLQECRLTRLINCSEEALDLLVQATPFQLDQERYVLFSIADISHEKRRRALERIFFHDIINLGGGADGLLEGLVTQAPADLRDDLELSHEAVHELVEEIETQRDLAAAERGELAVEPSLLNSVQILRQMARIYSAHPLAKDKVIRLAPSAAAARQPLPTGPAPPPADPSAAEESLPVFIVGGLRSAEEIGNKLRFSVHNPAGMPREVQLQIFKRSFTTKGAGRGLGTYSVKLLTEGHLKGRVHFISLPTQGTTFFVTLPLTLH